MCYFPLEGSLKLVFNGAAIVLTPKSNTIRGTVKQTKIPNYLRFVFILSRLLLTKFKNGSGLSLELLASYSFTLSTLFHAEVE